VAGRNCDGMEAVNIGSVSVDLHRKERDYDAKYAMDLPEGVRRFLADYHALHRKAYEESDYDALLTLLDGEQALREAELTDKQRKAITLVLRDGYTQEEAAEMLGLAGKPGVNNLVKRAVGRVAENEGFDVEAFKEWAEVYYGKRAVE